jgi:hypothetical protein
MRTRHSVTFRHKLLVMLALHLVVHVATGRERVVCI